MKARLLQLPIALLLALGVATGAAAQSTARRGDQTVLPVWNDTSGKFEAYLVLEPTEDAETGARFRFGNTSLDATFGLQAGDSLALLCKFKNGVGSAIGSLANKLRNDRSLETAARKQWGQMCRSISLGQASARAPNRWAKAKSRSSWAGTAMIAPVPYVAST